MIKKFKRFFSVLISVALILTATPLSGFATETETTEKDDVTITEATKYTVTYYSNGELYGETQTYASGETIIPPDAPQAPEGHIFNGWVINEQQEKLPETMPEKNIEASASWKLKDISISFLSDETEIHKTTVPYGSSIEETIPDDPQKEGYIFAGWYDKEGKNVFDYNTVPSEDISFAAKWLRNSNVIYKSDDKTFAAFEVKEGDKIPLPEKNPQKFAHKFIGWTPEIPSEMPADDLVFNAKYELDKDFVTVMIGGTLIAGAIVAGIGTAITGLSIVGGIISIIGLSSVIGNVNKTYTVTYKVDGKIYKTYRISSGSKVSVPESPKKDGYVFVKWNPDIPEKMPSKNITFEAVWSEIKSDIPDTGSTAFGLASFISLAISSAAAIIFAKKKEDK